jgi:hypothetical protein
LHKRQHKTLLKISKVLGQGIFVFYFILFLQRRIGSYQTVDTIKWGIYVGARFSMLAGPSNQIRPGEDKHGHNQEPLLKGGISTCDLLEQTSLDKLLLKLKVYVYFLQNNIGNDINCKFCKLV